MWSPDDEGARQRCLSLRFEHKRHWRAIAEAIGSVTETGAAICLDLCGVDGWLSYSRTFRHYDKPLRYRNPLYTCHHVVQQMEFLAAAGLILHDRRNPGERGWQSTAWATPELRAIIAQIVNGKTTLKRPSEVIWLRDNDKRLIDYKDTRKINRMRRGLERINEALQGAELDPSIAAPMVRIFNGSMKRGGRMYGMGASWQNMPSEKRKTITIGGQAVVELDYRSLHPAILYAEAGAIMPHDCYDLPGWPRPLVKEATLILINARTQASARQAIAHGKHIVALAEPGSQDAHRKAQALVDDIKVLHRPIEAAFHSDGGARLMVIDSDIAATVMSILIAQGIVALPVHDSFLVPASKAAQLETAMLEAAHRAGIYALKVAAI